MPRYQRQYGLNTAMPSTGASAAYSRLAQSLDSFGATANRLGAGLMASKAQRDAGAVEPSVEAPELRSPVTVYGQNYNDIVLKGHLAATQNAMSRHVGELAAQHPRDPAGFASAANEIRGEYLNNVAPEARSSAAISFDTQANNYLLDIQTRQAQDAIEASQLAQTEALSSVSNSAMEALRRGDEQAFIAATAVYEDSLAGSSLTETQKVQALITYKRDANLAVSMGEIRAAMSEGRYEDVADHIEGVRNGSIPMLYADTGMTSEDAADYLQEQFKKYVADQQAELSAHEVENNLADARIFKLREETRAAAYDLMADRALTVEWVRENREAIGPEDYDYFLKAASTGGGFADAVDPGAYINLINSAVAGDDVKPEAEAALRAGLIEKSWYDQIVEQITDRRFGSADMIVSESLKIDNAISPFARASYAEAMSQWQRWKQANPEATLREAMDEARAIVRDTLIVGEKIDSFAYPRPRHVQLGSDGRTMDLAATKKATNEAFSARLGIPADATPAERKAALASDPEYMIQADLIAQWQRLQNRMREVDGG